MRLMRAMRFGSLLAIGLIAVIAQSAVSITLAVLGYGAAALAWGYLASTSVMAVATIAYQPDTVALRPSLAGAGHLLTFGAWTSATLLVGNATKSAPQLMIGRVSGMADAALFSRAQNLLSLVNGLFGGLRPLLPSLGEREAQGATLAPIYLRLVEAVTGLAWPAYAVLAIWGEPLVRTIYGEAWSAAGRMMAPIAIAHGLTLAVAAKYDILIVKRRPRLLFACELSVFVFAIIALELGLTVGVEAAVWSLVVSSVFFVVCYVMVLKTVVEFAPTALFKVWGRSLILVLAVVPAPLVFRHLASGHPVEVMLGFAVSSAISGVIWIASTMLIRHELSIHIIGLLRSASLSSWLAAFRGFRLQPNETEQG
jgi:O-antigen/teichoic acid export membrane protein